MEKKTKRLLGGIALAGSAAGAIGALLIKKNSSRRKQKRKEGDDVWARPGMEVIFRAELMPGRDGSQRTFRVKELLPSGRVVLQDFIGEHAEKEFEAVK
jgi:hypothetical protein